MSLSKFSIFDLQSEYLRGKMFLRLFKEGFLFAINSLTVNKLRTFLSLFGITIGIFCIISVFTVLDWLENQYVTVLTLWAVMSFMFRNTPGP